MDSIKLDSLTVHRQHRTILQSVFEFFIYKVIIFLNTHTDTLWFIIVFILHTLITEELSIIIFCISTFIHMGSIHTPIFIYICFSFKLIYISFSRIMCCTYTHIYLFLHICSFICLHIIRSCFWVWVHLFYDMCWDLILLVQPVWAGASAV